MQDNTKLIRNQVNGNLLSTLNQYIDSFYVSMRTLLPTNYEKLIVNPTKGDDLPNSALPQIPFSAFVREWFNSDKEVSFLYDPNGDAYDLSAQLSVIMRLSSTEYLDGADPEMVNSVFSYALCRYALMATILSRGQLLDYLGVQFDVQGNADFSILQQAIDEFFDNFARLVEYVEPVFAYEVDIPLADDVVVIDPFGTSRTYRLVDFDGNFDLSLFRSALADVFERGKMLYFPSLYVPGDVLTNLVASCNLLLNNIVGIVFPYNTPLSSYIDDINDSTNPFERGHISPLPMLAYQQIIAQYFSNNTVDNIFNADLYMQLLRAVMFPNEESSAFTKEPTFTYNGVSTEYDYASAGAFYYSLLSNEIAGRHNRSYVFATLFFLLRRSLRYGDYFATARPRMLAVGQLGINVENGMVSPIDVTRNLLMQRYLNAANYIGSGFLPYFASIYGVTPSDTMSIPRYISHRKIEIGNQITNNTAEKQGAQTTNLIAHSDDTAYDVFIDDHGILLNLMSFDTLPIYTSGLDSIYHLADRFDFFNPMLQNIGDQPIMLSELLANDTTATKQFGWTMRNKEYKYKNSRAHGIFCTNLANGYLVRYPYDDFVYSSNADVKISSDFIRDKPRYLDRVLNVQTGTSPANYWHFLVSCTNVVKTARAIQATPPVLF